jgi:hypothetical protein
MCSFVETNDLVREVISQNISFVEQAKSLAKSGQTNERFRELFTNRREKPIILQAHKFP